MKIQCEFCKKEYSKYGIKRHIFLKHTEEGRVFLEKNNKDKFKKYQQEFGCWSKGLTKSDERVRLRSEKSRNTLLKSSKVTGRGKTYLSEKIRREKISVSRSKILENFGAGGFKNVRWYPIKNILNEEFICRGTWEQKFALWLNDNGILWIRKKYLEYSVNDIKKTYTPDFYIPDEDLYFEVKGYFSENDREKIRLVEQCNNLRINLIFGRHIKNLDKINNLSELMTIIRI